MGNLVEWARHFFEPLARQSQITLSLQNCVAGVSFPADRHRLEQVLLNLVLNSIRAMPNGGWIELGVGDFLLAESNSMFLTQAPGSPAQTSAYF